MKKSPYRILLADSQALTVAGLTQVLSGSDDYEIAGTVSQRTEFLSLMEEHQPDLLIVDYNMPGYITIEDLTEATKAFVETNVVVVSSDDRKASVLEVLQLGVKGYLTKECSREEVLMAVQSALRGEKFYCHKILDIIMEKHFSPEPVSVDAGILTARETEILTLIANGRSSQQIADDLHLSPHTIHTHRKSIIRKLSIKSPTEFVIYAIDLGLIRPK